MCVCFRRASEQDESPGALGQVQPCDGRRAVPFWGDAAGKAKVQTRREYEQGNCLLPSIPTVKWERGGKNLLGKKK